MSQMTFLYAQNAPKSFAGGASPDPAGGSQNSPDLIAAGHIYGHITVIMLPKDLQEQQRKQIPLHSSRNEYLNMQT